MNEVTACYRILCRSKIMESFNVSYSADENNNFDYLAHHHHHHDRQKIPIHRISSYPAARKEPANDDRHSPKNVAVTANLIISRSRTKSTKKKQKSNSDSIVQSNIPTNIAPRKIFGKRRLMSVMPKSFSEINETNEDMADTIVQRQQPTQRQLLRQNQQQQTMIIREQHQQQQ